MPSNELKITDYAVKLAFFNDCCLKNLRFQKSYYNKKRQKMTRIYKCCQAECDCRMLLLGKRTKLPLEADKRLKRSKNDSSKKNNIIKQDPR